MKLFLKNNLPVLLAYFAVLLVAFFFLNSFDRQNIHLYLNGFVGHLAIDNFFFYITYLGDGTVAVILLLILLFLNFRLGLYTAASFITASLVSIGLKELFFDDENRPFFVFNFYTAHKLKLVDGVQVYIHNSFPSGHATQAFAIFMCLAFATPKQALKFLFLFIAVLTAYSRVHLSQHWLLDITVGSIIGSVFSIVYYFVFIPSSRFNRLDKSLFVFIRLWRLK